MLFFDITIERVNNVSISRYELNPYKGEFDGEIKQRDSRKNSHICFRKIKVWNIRFVKMFLVFF